MAVSIDSEEFAILSAPDRRSERHISLRGRKEVLTWKSGRSRQDCGIIQALACPNGVPAWVSDVHPGSKHDFPVARTEKNQP